MKLPQQKIGILSMQRVVNFGSVLQAYSLRSLISQITGAPVCFVDIDEHRSCPSMKSVKESVDYETPVSYPPGLLQRAKRWLIARGSAYNKKLIRRFMEQELRLDDTAACDCTHVVIGSDEVFNHRNEQVCFQLHGDVAPDVKVITYAASCGNAKAQDIPGEHLRSIREAMGKIQSMSVRDSATEAYVHELCGTQIQRHLDPVLVGDLRFRQHRAVPLKKYLVVYAYGHRIRSREEIDAIQSFAHKRGLKTVALGGSQFWTDLYVPASPFRMLDYFYFADYVVTDTFHGAIFSVINTRPFAVLPRKTNHAKLTGLLEDLGLSDRMTTSAADLESVLDTAVDYESVEDILILQRQRTIDYLSTNLGEKM